MHNYMDVDECNDDINTNINLKSLDELLAKDFPPTEWIVDGLIPEQAIVLLSAHPASFKTWLALDLSLKVATGEKFLNRFNTNKTGVLIMDAESGDRQLQKHFKILGASSDLPIYYQICNRKRVDKRFAADLLVKCLEKNIKLVIFDSLTRFHDANENDSREMSGVFESFTTLKNHGITCLIICHSRKNGVGDLNRQSNCRSQAESIRGSSDILAACDMHFSINRKDNSNVITITQTKSRFDVEINPFAIRFIKDSSVSSHWEFLETLDTKEDEFERTKGQVYESIVKNPGLNQKELFSAIKESGIRCGEKSLTTILRDLAFDKVVYSKPGNKRAKLYYAVDSLEEGKTAK